MSELRRFAARPLGLALAVRPAGLVEAPGSTARRRRVPRSNAASLNLAASCQPVPVTFSSRTSSCPLNVAELL